MIQTIRMESDERMGEEMEPAKGKVTRSGTFGDYEVTGWRYKEEAAWHLYARIRSACGVKLPPARENSRDWES
jgi:hypothetical protein